MKKQKIACDLRLSADGAAVRNSGRLVACYAVSEYGSMLEAHRAASEYAYEFGGEVVGYIERAA